MIFSKAFFAATTQDFLRTPLVSVIAELSRRTALIHRGNEIQQVHAWEKQLQILHSALRTLGDKADDWGILLEYPLLRLGRRIDAVLLAGGRVLVIEFKIGATRFLSADQAQAEDYALCLRDFHAGSSGREIVPVLCAERAHERQMPCKLIFDDGVCQALCVNEITLRDVVALAAADGIGSSQFQISLRDFDQAAYNPTPTIVEAAKAIYAGHNVREIGRADAAADAIDAAAARLREIARKAEAQKCHVVCFVTGTPGSGKTLLGLNMVFSTDAASISGESAALLSGNRPLVHVLQEALAEDAAVREGSKLEARRRAQAGLQNLLGYLKEHSGNADVPPPEHVIVYDEAQRAWDEETGNKLLGRPKSEPALFFEIMSRLPWACLVCLLGPGQEINRGEGGLSIWGKALNESFKAGTRWEAHVSPMALNGNDELVGAGLLDLLEEHAFPVTREPALHLTAGVRAYRNRKHGQWVEALLAGDVTGAGAIAGLNSGPPVFITRDLFKLRSWLKSSARGGRRCGLLASAGAVRLTGEGIPPSPRSNELDLVSHWFLRPQGDFRSSNALETPLSEFVCQGLEVDYVGLCWGGDLIWGEDGWIARAMRAPKWQTVRNEERRLYKLNSYRVLLTRARAGLAIWIPHGDPDDPTRSPEEMDRISSALLTAGCRPL